MIKYDQIFWFLNLVSLPHVYVHERDGEVINYDHFLEIWMHIRGGGDVDGCPS